MGKLLEFTDFGIYCREADVFIDPWKPVAKALITHGHSDHARVGNNKYLCHTLTAPILCYRLGEHCNIQTVEYGEVLSINNIKFSFHPAGHIPGSSQVRVERNGEVWVVSGDYKLENDTLSTSFEPINCHTFITESTFGLPIYKWPGQEEVFSGINSWWKANREKGLTSVIAGYALGKAQRIVNALDARIGTLYTHGAVENINEIFRRQGLDINPTHRVTPEMPKDKIAGNIVIAPPSALASPWMNRFRPYSTAIASGWMALRGARRRRSVDRGFILSDHADWNGLNEAIKLSGAENVICTHGYTAVFSRWLKEKGIESSTETTAFEGELSEINEAREKGDG